MNWLTKGGLCLSLLLPLNSCAPFNYSSSHRIDLPPMEYSDVSPTFSPQGDAAVSPKTTHSSTNIITSIQIRNKELARAEIFNRNLEYPFSTKEEERLMGGRPIKDYETLSTVPIDYFTDWNQKRISYIHSSKSPYNSPFLSENTQYLREEQIPTSELAKLLWDGIIRRGTGPIMKSIQKLDDHANDLWTYPFKFILPDSVERKIRFRASQKSIGARLELSGESTTFNLEYRIDRGSENFRESIPRKKGNTIYFTMEHKF